MRLKCISEDELSDRFDVDTIRSNINTPKEYSRALCLLEALRIPIVSIVGWSGSGKPLACMGDEKLIAVVTDEELDADVPVLDFDSIGKAADLIVELCTNNQ